MGVDLGDLAVKHTISLESLSGKIIAVDSYNMIYQFLASIRQEDGTPLSDFKGNPTAHLSGLFYRTVRLLENGIKPIFVFDGKAHSFKEKTQMERRVVKEKAAQMWKQAIEAEKFEEAKKYAQGTSRLTGQMVEESKQLLGMLGVPCVQAPSDGEAQAALMVQKGVADATASQDYDALLFGSNILLRNISITGRRKVPRSDKYIVVEPEEIILKETLNNLNFSREQLILIGLLLGTDFNDGVKGIGPKKALKLVQGIKTLDELVDHLKNKEKYEFEVDPREVFNIFMNPPYFNVEHSKWSEADKEGIMKLLITDHDFSTERVERTIDALIAIRKERGAQSKLEKWF